MKIVKFVTTTVLACGISLSALADCGQMKGGNAPMMDHQDGNMPMMQGKRCGRMMQGKRCGMQMMQQKQKMMQEHMKKTETHLANIENLLRQLVESQN